MPKIIKRLAGYLMLFVASLTISLLAAEFIVRIAYPEKGGDHDKLFCYHEKYGWEFCKNIDARVVTSDYDHSISSDNSGQRYFGEADTKRKNIIVLGDSFTSNIGIEDPSDVFTEVLEQKLGKYNVVNLGVNGYGTTQEYLKLQTKKRLYDPEIVILMFYIRNDFYDNIGMLDWIQGYERPLFVWKGNKLELTNVPVPQKRRSVIHTLGKHSHFVAFARDTLVQTSAGQALRRLIHSEQKDTASTPPEAVLASDNSEIQTAFHVSCEILSLINTELEQEGVEFYVVIIPSIFQVRNDHFSKLKEFGVTDSDRFHANSKLRECAILHGLQIIDLTPPLMATENSHLEPFLYFPTEHHWTVQGNQAVAEIIHGSLIEYSNILKQGMESH